MAKKWKPLVGKGGKGRKPLAEKVFQKQEKLSEIELIRQRNIDQRTEMLKAMKAAALAANPPKAKKPRTYKHNPEMRRKQPKREYGTRSKAPKLELPEDVSHFHEKISSHILSYLLSVLSHFSLFFFSGGNGRRVFR